MQVHLRKLVLKDAPLMLEWMKDPSIACFFRFNAATMTEDKCRTFIMAANNDTNSTHFAIANENDEYLGTISLKNIEGDRAEYAISTRKCAHGTGVALQATKEILRIAFEELGLEMVYLNVLTENARANAFYRKAGFRFTHCETNGVKIRGEKRDLNWYEYHRNNWYKE